MGYAIPISTAKPIFSELMLRETKDKVNEEERGYLGISCINVTSDLSANFNMPEGIFVAEVYEGTGAERAGLVRGDIITEFDGITVKNQNELTARMEYYKVGETVEITIMQGSPNGYQPKKVTVTLSSYDELEEASRKKQLEEQKNSRQNNRFWP
ncbi:MAG: S1C family serine protease [Eisenbergiella sp.]